MEQIDQKIVKASQYLCPCGSGRPIINCCVTSRINTTPPLPKTGYSNPKCYAQVLNDCDEKITAEHIVSRSVLNLIEIPRKLMKISGAHWISHGEEKSVALNELKSKVLCKRHNQALSGLDDIGKKFFEFIMGVNIKSEFLMINGDEIERWMLKLLSGFIASKFIPTYSKNWQIPDSWAQILFGSNRLPQGSGIYLLRGKDVRVNIHQIGVWPIESDEQGIFNGLYFFIGGFQFLFFMGTPRRQLLMKIFNSGWQIRYRPECIVIASEKDQREIHLGIPPKGGFVVIKVTS
jgi:hypothetical protein